MAETDVSAAPFSGRTAWTRNLQTPLRSFLQHGDRQRRRPPRAPSSPRWSGRTSTPRRTSASGRRRSRSGSARTRISHGPARLDQQRPDDLLLLRDRARGPARVRPRRAARAAARGAAAPRRPRRDGRARRDLSGDQRRPRLGPRLGSGDVDRHRVRARRCSRSSARACPTACAPSAHGRRSSTTSSRCW